MGKLAFEMSKIAALAVVAALLGAFVAGLLHAGRAPTVGATVGSTPSLAGARVIALDQSAPAFQAGWRANDVIIEAAGHPVSSSSRCGPRPCAKRRHISGSALAPITAFQIEGGRSHELSPINRGVWRLLIAGLPHLLPALVWLITALTWPRSATHRPTAALLYGGAASMGASLLIGALLSHQDLLPWPSWTQPLDPLTSAIRGLAGTLLISAFFLHFRSQQATWGRTRWGLLFAAFAAPSLLVALAEIKAVLPAHLDLATRVPIGMGVLLFAWASRALPGFASQLHAGWLLLGLGVAAAGSALAVLVDEVVGQACASLAIAAIPAAAMLAELESTQLWLDRVAIGAAAALTTLAVVVGLGHSLPGALGMPLPPVSLGLLLTAAVTAVALLLAWTWRHAVPQSIRADPIPHRAEATLFHPTIQTEHRSGLPRRAPPLEPFLEHITEQLQRAAKVRGVQCWHLAPDDLWVPYGPGGAGPAVPVDREGAVIRALGAARRPLIGADLPDGTLTPRERALLEGVTGGTTAALIPCRSGDELIGALQMGEPLRGGRIDLAYMRWIWRVGYDLGPRIEQARALDRASQREQLLRELLDDETRAHLTVLGQLGHITETGRAASRSGANSMGPRRSAQRFRVDRVVTEVGIVLEPTLKAEGIHLQTTTTTDLAATPLRAYGDPRALRLALTWICRECIGELTDWQGPRRITVRAVAQATDIQIELRDTGMGTPAHARPVSTVASWLDTEGEPLPIRLAMARSFLDPFGGKLCLTTQPGRGSAILVTLPSSRPSSSRRRRS